MITGHVILLLGLLPHLDDIMLEGGPTRTRWCTADGPSPRRDLGVRPVWAHRRPRAQHLPPSSRRCPPRRPTDRHRVRGSPVLLRQRRLPSTDIRRAGSRVDHAAGPTDRAAAGVEVRADRPDDGGRRGAARILGDEGVEVVLERAKAPWKSWKILRKIRSSPSRATTLVRAVQTLILAADLRLIGSLAQIVNLHASKSPLNYRLRSSTTGVWAAMPFGGDQASFGCQDRVFSCASVCATDSFDGERDRSEGQEQMNELEGRYRSPIVGNLKLPPEGVAEDEDGRGIDPDEQVPILLELNVTYPGGLRAVREALYFIWGEFEDRAGGSWEDPVPDPSRPARSPGLMFIAPKLYQCVLSRRDLHELVTRDQQVARETGRPPAIFRACRITRWTRRSIVPPPQ